MSDCWSTIKECIFGKKQIQNDDDNQTDQQLGQAVPNKKTNKYKSSNGNNKQVPNLDHTLTINKMLSTDQQFDQRLKHKSNNNKKYNQKKTRQYNSKQKRIDPNLLVHTNDQVLGLFYQRNQEKVQVIPRPNYQIKRQVTPKQNKIPLQINLVKDESPNRLSTQGKDKSFQYLIKKDQHRSSYNSIGTNKPIFQQPIQNQILPKIQIQQIHISSSSSQDQVEEVQQKEEQKIQIVEADSSLYERPKKEVVEPLLTKLKKIQAGTSQHIENSQPFPYSRIGVIQMEMESQNVMKKMRHKFKGSGTIIGPRYVITACHNLYNYQKEIKYQLKCFRLYYRHFNVQPQFGKQFKIRKSFGHLQEYKAAILKGDYTLDYAFLELDTEEDLQQFNNFRIDFGPQQDNEQKLIISYPLNKEKIVQFTESKGKTISQNNHIYHQFNIRQGSSGGPIFKIQDNEYIIIALHAGGAYNQTQSQFQCRVGPKITEKIFSDLVQFMASCDGHVDLKNKNIGHEGCRLLVQAVDEQLTHLNLTNNKIGLQACKQIVKCRWINLSVLNLSNNFLNASSSFQILKDIKLPSLRQLILGQNHIQQQCCRHLIEADFPTLQILNLGYNNIGDEGCQILSNSKWPSLKKLYLFWNSIEEKGCYYLSKGNWPQLQFIDLHENTIDSQGCKFLTRAKWDNLTEIILDKNILGDIGCKYLTESNWNNIERVHLWRNSITSLGIGYLLNSTWSKLSYINLSQNSIDNPESTGELFLKKHSNLDIVLE